MPKTFGKRLLDALVALIVLGAIAVFGWTLTTALFYSPSTELPVPSLASTAPATGVPSAQMPSRLVIPALQIDANIQYVGIANSGNMMPPSNFTDVGWYKYGAVPGQLGSAVMDGHVDNGLALPGVFKRLQEIAVGDDIYVQTRGGQQLRFVVQDIEVYPYKSVPTDLLFERKDTARLNLITCAGAWVQSGRTYDRRVVVYATLAV